MSTGYPENWRVLLWKPESTRRCCHPIAGLWSLSRQVRAAQNECVDRRVVGKCEAGAREKIPKGTDGETLAVLSWLVRSMHTLQDLVGPNKGEMEEGGVATRGTSVEGAGEKMLLVVSKPRESGKLSIMSSGFCGFCSFATWRWQALTSRIRIVFGWRG